MFGVCQRVPRSLELLRREADVGMPPEAARPDACGFDGRRFAQAWERHERTEREAPRPALARRVVLRLAHDLDDGEDVLPARRVADAQIAPLHARPPRRGVRLHALGVDLVGEEVPGASANEEPMLDHRAFLTRPEYARRIRACLVVLLLAAVTAGCGDSSSEEAAPPAQGETTTTAATTTSGD